MKIMCDTNVIIDVLLEREPFIEDSYKVLKLCEEHKIDGFVRQAECGGHLVPAGVAGVLYQAPNGSKCRGMASADG